MKNIEILKPDAIEKRSFEIISQILGDKNINSAHEKIIKRAIHTSADFEYADNLYFSDGVVDMLENAIKNGACIVTDTQMGKAGINKSALAKFGGEVYCFMSDEDVAENAKIREVTRATVSMEKACTLGKPVIFAIGNAPTALISINELFNDKKLNPIAVIGVPVGFVNVIESKELIMSSKIPCIIARGRKGGSNIAAAICNALIYS